MLISQTSNNAGSPLAGGPLAGGPLTGGPLAGSPLAGGPLATSVFHHLSLWTMVFVALCKVLAMNLHSIRISFIPFTSDP